MVPFDSLTKRFNTPTEFRQWIKTHYNIMTPHIVSIRQVQDYFLELSQGTGIDSKMLYGVTVFHWNGEKFDNMSHPYSESNRSLTDRVKAWEHFEYTTKCIKEALKQ